MGHEEIFLDELVDGFVPGLRGDKGEQNDDRRAEGQSNSKRAHVQREREKEKEKESKTNFEETSTLTGFFSEARWSCATCA